MTLLSIIIATYNSEKTIKKCLDSIFRQTLTDFELIIIDDFSKDNCLSIIEEYDRKYDNIRIIRNKHRKGIAESKNIGLNNAKGYFVSFIDSYDYLINKHSYEFMIKAAIKYNLPLCSSNIQFNTKNDVKEGNELFSNYTEIKKFSISNYAIPELLEKNIVKRDVLLKNNITFPDIACGENRIFLANILLHVAEYVHIPQKLYAYNCSKLNSINTFEKYRDLLYSHCQVIKLFDEKKQLADHKKLLKNLLTIKNVPVNIFSNKQMDEVNSILYEIKSLIYDYDKELTIRFDSIINDINKSYELKYNHTLSVIIYVKNDEKYLNDLLNSLRFQNESDVEIICINDCSKDSSSTLLSDFSKCNDFARIKIINKLMDSNLKECMFQGFKESNGKNILFLSAKSWLDCDTFTIIEELDKNEHDLILFKKLFKKQKMNLKLNEYGYNKDKQELLQLTDKLKILSEEINIVFSRNYLNYLLDNYSNEIFNDENTLHFCSLLYAQNIIFLDKYLENVQQCENGNQYNSVCNLDLMIESFKNEDKNGKYDECFLSYILNLFIKCYSGDKNKKNMSKLYKNKLKYYISKYSFEITSKELQDKYDEFIAT